ncbi:MAG: adenylate/guanylate cyclase domain-containing protein [Chloroflexi bacterium]|nr:adenylate/guanylate cyclase domain-containing protein [Chloroflexota bacterium]
MATGTLAALALPLLGLALLLLRPELDLVWEHHPSHFWLVLLTAIVSMALAFATNEAASRHADARLFMVGLAFLASAGFLGLHALATPGVLLPEPNTGFVIATPVGLVVAAVLSAASVSPLAGPHGALVLRYRDLLRTGLVVGLVAWGAVSILRLEPLRSPMPAENLGGPLTVVALVAVALYAYAAWRYLGIARRRQTPVAIALLAAMVLLAEAMIAVAISRSWHISWWEWHLLLTAAFGTIAIAVRREYRRTGSVASVFRPIYGSAALARIDRWHGQAMAEIADLEARGERADRVLDDLRRDGASEDEVAVLAAAAREVRRIEDLLGPFLPQQAVGELVAARHAAAGGAVGGNGPRTVTALFADLAGFTSFSEHREPATVIGMLNAYWAAVVPIIDAAGGRIEHFAGDGVLAIFDGEDQAERGASCAVALLAATNPIAEEHGWPRFRIGMNSGAAVTGTVGADARRSIATIGDTTNLAARLMAVAEPGGIVIGATTRAGLDGEQFRLDPLGEIQVKGKREPVEAWRLTN